MLQTLSRKLCVMWCYTPTLPLSECLHISFCGLYNVVLGNYSVQIPPGERGVYCQRKAWRITYDIFVWYGATMLNI